MKRFACALVLVACGGSSTPPPSSVPAETTGSSDAAPLAAISPDAGLPSGTFADDAGTSTPTPTSTSTLTPTPTPTSDDADTGDPGSVAYLESVQVLLKKNRDALTKACWLKSKSAEHAYAGKAVIRVGTGGKVQSIQTDGTDDAASACITKQLKKWSFPPPNGTATVDLPIRLRRD